MCKYCNLKAIEIGTSSGIRVMYHCESIIDDSTRVDIWKVNDRNVLQTSNDLNSNKVDITYCPFCGRKL
jgi:hypothetical protein